MARKLIIFVLLLTVWAALYLLLNGGAPASFSYLFSPAHPSNQPLPQPWTNQPARVRLLASEPTIESDPQVPTGVCPPEYDVRKGDTLGVIASRCGVQVADLQALNPTLANPNRIYPGQRLILYTQGTKAQPALSSSKAMPTAVPGSKIRVEVTGLPASAPVRVGIGLTSSGFQVLFLAAADENGTLKTDLVIPIRAAAGDHAFVLVTSRERPSAQAVSETFMIAP